MARKASGPTASVKPDEEIEAADLAVILVDHPDVPYDLICRSASLVLDTKGCLRGRELQGEFL